MSLADPLTIKYEGKPLEGIVKHIKSIYSDPIGSNIIATEAQTSDAKYLVTWNEMTSFSCNEKAYSLFRFPGRFLFPTHYTITGVFDWYYQKKWTIHGYNSGEENDKSKWTLLGENESTSDKFCGTAEKCNSNTPATYSMKPTNKGFEFIRFQSEISSHSDASYSYFITSATEFFGTLSKTNKVTTVKIKVSIYRKCTLKESLSLLRFFMTIIISK